MDTGSESATLLVVDVQSRLFPAISGADRILKNCLRLTEAARLLGIATCFTEQNPEGLGATVEALGPYAECCFRKTHFDACEEADFAGWAVGRAPGIVVAGMESHVCVLQTALGLLRLGRAPRVVADAVGSRDDANRLLALERLRGHGVEVVSTEMVVFEWLSSCDHPRFRDVLKLLK